MQRSHWARCGTGKSLHHPRAAGRQGNEMIRFPLEGQGETSSWRATTSPPGRFIGLAGVNGGSVFVVVWEPRHGRGGGHQLVLEPDKAEKLRRQMSRERPDDGIRI